MERESKGASALDEAGNSYAVFDNQWVTYDSPSNVIEKVLRNMSVFLLNSLKVLFNILMFYFFVTDEIRDQYRSGRCGGLGCRHGRFPWLMWNIVPDAKCYVY